MKRYCVRVCLWSDLTNSDELFELLSCIKSSGGIEKTWQSDGNIFVDIAAPADCPVQHTIHYCHGLAERMRLFRFNAVSVPSQL